MGVLLCSSGTGAFPYLLPGEKQTLAAYMKGSFPAAWRRNRAIIEFERGRSVGLTAGAAKSRSIFTIQTGSKP